MSVEIRTGIKDKHCKEMTEVGEVMTSWVAKRTLTACFRAAANICNGTVGYLFDTKTNWQSLKDVLHQSLPALKVRLTFFRLKINLTNSHVILPKLFNLDIFHFKLFSYIYDKDCNIDD